MIKISQLEILGFGSRIARDFFQRRGGRREWVVLMYQPIESVYFRSVAASSFYFILFSFTFMLSSQTFIDRSVQNTFKFVFYTNRSRRILLRQISNRQFFESSVEFYDFQT